MKEIFSRRLKELVGDRPVTEFSRFVGIPQATIDRYLKKIRSPSGEYVARISTVTGVSADWLLGLSDQRAALRPAEYPLHAADPPAPAVPTRTARSNASCASWRTSPWA